MKKPLVFILFLLAILGAIQIFSSKDTPKNKSKDIVALASCLSKKGVVFYGAYWCGYCAKQKAAFGEAEKYLNYVECHTQGSQEQLSICSGGQIRGYPTWEFSDGSRMTGFVLPGDLAYKSDCPW